MDKTTQSPGLLDRLANVVGCEYLSELKQPKFQDAICEALEQIPADSFPAEEWTEAVDYLISQGGDDHTNAFHARLLKHIGQTLTGTEPI